MESELARRRIDIIAAHFTCANDLSSAASRLLPLNCSSSLSSAVRRPHDSRVLFARQSSSAQSFFMRQASTDLGNNAFVEAPLYSRPAKVVKQDYGPTEPPKYARPTKHVPTSKPHEGVEWVPRMNIAEFEREYVISMELSGVDIRDIKVEVNAKSLIVTGRRNTMWTANTYHKRQILQGPCQVVWPLPSHVNEDGISAEFVEGILQINIPRL